MDSPSPARSRETRLTLLLQFLVGASGLAAASTFVIAATRRVTYPYELEWLESEMLQHVARILAGQSLYTAPTQEFSPTIYPPMFAWVSALAASVVGFGFQAPRLVSAISTALIALVAGLVATGLGGDRRGGLVASGLVLATYVACGTMLDLARLDPLWVLLLLAATAAAAGARGTAGWVGTGLLLAAANATKQPAGLFAIVIAGAVATQSRRGAAIVLGTWVGSCAAFFGALHLATAGWSTIYLIQIPLRVPHVPGQLVHFLRDDLLRGFAPATALILLWTLTPRNRRPGEPLPTIWWAAFVAAVCATTIMRTIQGGSLNTLLPLFVFGAVMTGAIAGRLLHHGSPEVRHGVLVALVLQFAMQVYNPRNFIPDAELARRSAALVERLRSFPGEVWIPSHTAYAHQAGKPWLVHRDPLLDLLYSGWDAFPQDLVHSLRAGRFAAVVLDGPFAEPQLNDALTAGYGPAEEITEAPAPLTGYRTIPHRLYLPRPRARSEPGTVIE